MLLLLKVTHFRTAVIVLLSHFTDAETEADGKNQLEGGQDDGVPESEGLLSPWQENFHSPALPRGYKPRATQLGAGPLCWLLWPTGHSSVLAVT